MARIGVAIMKRCSFRLGTQHFSNVYHYERPTLPNAAEQTDIVNDIVTTEKKLHSTDVTFVVARLWSAGGTPAQNNMLLTQTLSGTGNLTPDSRLDRERAILAFWPAGVDVRGKPVFLRKYYHLCGSFPGPTTVPDSVMGNIAAIATSTRDAIATIVQENHDVPGVAPSFTLVSERGRVATGSAQCHRFLEHHQFGDEWRGQ